MNRIKMTWLASLAALVVTFVAIGCSTETMNPASSNNESAQLLISPNSGDESSIDDILFGKGSSAQDSTNPRGGGTGKGKDTVRKDTVRKDTVRKGGGDIRKEDSLRKDRGVRERSKFDSLKLVIPCLKLSREQMSQLEKIMKGYRENLNRLNFTARAAAKEKQKSANAEIRAIMEKVKAGEMTAEEGRAAVKEIRRALEAEIKAIRIRLNGAIEELQGATLREIGSILTEEQLALYRRWMTTGVLPCDGVSPNPRG